MSRRPTRQRKLRHRRLLFLALFVGAALVGWTFVRITLQENTLAREAAGVQAEIALLELQNAQLNAQVALRKTDNYLEQKARELGYVKPGEGLATLKDAPRESATARAQSDARPATRFARWLDLFLRN